MMRRRSFLQGVAATTAGMSITQLAAGRAGGSNDRVRLGLIGCGGRGRYVAGHMQRVPGVEFVAACDVYQPNRLRVKQWAGKQCQDYADFRQVLDRADIDAVLVATPDHWHAIPTVLACEAGKDVYVEKPLAHNIREGRAMVEAARRTDRIVQTGTQQRSAEHFHTMRDIIRQGKLGNIRYVRIWNYRNSTRRGMEPTSASEPPEGLDWDFYLGPAPYVPYDGNRFLGSFRRFWDYAGGIATDFGTHRFDSMRQVLDMDDVAPRTISAAGSRYEMHDGSEDPDVVQMTFEFPDFVLSYEACRMNGLGSGYRTPGRPYYRMMGTHDRPNGMAFYGTEGTIFADRLGFEIYPELKPGRRADRLPPEEVTPELFRTERQEGRSGDSTFLHAENFIHCVRSRDRPICDVQIGHASSILPHLGNIAYRVGHKLIWNGETEEITNSPEGSRLLGREARKPWDLISLRPHRLIN